ncbi:MAG: hypothetical protein HN738_08475 [Gammaproteobacteria bacterium]|nr:hypothetical protein [Gammaproteobacteria bacterium]
MYPESKVTVTIGDNPEWHCRQDAATGFWSAWKADPDDTETGAPLYHLSSFDEIVKVISSYEDAFAAGVEAGRANHE